MRNSGNFSFAFATMLVAGASAAEIRFTNTTWLAGVPVPGILCTNASGQAYLKGNMHVGRVLSDEPRVRGRITAYMDLAYTADGGCVLSGPAHCELGVWDAEGTHFTANGGVWDMLYHGVGHPDGSSEYLMSGYGLGGDIEGMQIQVTVTRAAAAPFDPTVPYLGAGVIKAAPVNARLAFDDFSQDELSAQWTAAYTPPPGSCAATATEERLTLSGSWTKPTGAVADTTTWISLMHNWTIDAGQTLEARVDVMGPNVACAAPSLALYHADAQGYLFAQGADWVMIIKQYWSMTVLGAWKCPARNTNATYSLLLTAAGQNLIITVRVLDKATGEVLFQQAVVDTPAAEPSLTAEQVAQITGGRTWQGISQDVAEAPWKSGNATTLLLFQDTDGNQPSAETIFDNLEVRLSDSPPLSIQRAALVSWPAGEIGYSLESAPTPQGPWLPVFDTAAPHLQQRSIPVNGSMEFFRTRQAP